MQVDDERGVVPVPPNVDTPRPGSINAPLSNEPLSVVIDENQSQLKDLVNSVITILEQAALNGVTRDNVLQKYALAQTEQQGSPLRLFFQIESRIAAFNAALNSDIIVKIIQAVGNRDEIVNNALSQDNNYVRELSETINRPL